LSNSGIASRGAADAPSNRTPIIAWAEALLTAFGESDPEAKAHLSAFIQERTLAWALLPVRAPDSNRDPNAGRRLTLATPTKAAECCIARAIV
jgi:hypothetical protein